MMNRSGLYCLLFFLPAISACQKAAAPESAAVVKARIDSSVQAQLPTLRQKAAEDLDKRSAIEVKAKTDSIVHAIMFPKKADTTHKAPDVNNALKRRQLIQQLHGMDTSRMNQKLLR